MLALVCHEGPQRFLRKHSEFPSPGPCSLSGPDAGRCYLFLLASLWVDLLEERVSFGVRMAGSLMDVCLWFIPSLPEARPVVLGGLPRGIGSTCGFLPSQLGRRASLAK